MNATQELDEVLKYLHGIQDHVYIKTIREHFKEKKDVNILLEKLLKDGYCTSPIENNYKLSLEGRLFIESGGYKQQFINQNAENTRIGKLETSQRKTQQKLFWLTFVVAVATLVQAVYDCVELYWKYHWFH